MCICAEHIDSHIPMGSPHTVWSIPAIHGELEHLIRLHDHIYEFVQPQDRIIYHGNYTGYGAQSAACIEEILTFRRMVLGRPGMMPSDFVYLRGQQELIWEKMLQLPFAQHPTQVLEWMLDHGLRSTLHAYGLSPQDALEATQLGAIYLTRWIQSARRAVRIHAGHEQFMTGLKRAAYTDKDSLYPMLFVHAGLDPAHALNEQGDGLWWASDAFRDIRAAYTPFQKVIRGFDPDHAGLHLNCITATVDNGCGFGGNLVSVGFNPDGGVSQILEV